MTTDAPRQAALNTTEILENILSYLPNRTVFGVQRVCRQWRDAIAVSPTIQDELFLRLRGQTPETWLLTNPEEKKFRVAAPADIESPSEVNFGQRPLFMPVTLNPCWNGGTTPACGSKKILFDTMRVSHVDQISYASHSTAVQEPRSSPILHQRSVKLALTSSLVQCVLSSASWEAAPTLYPTSLSL
jgi:hypothetical protein